MNCEQVRNSISGFVDESSSSILQQAIGNHIKRCDDCSIVRDQEQFLVEQLTNSTIPEPSEGFFAQALKNAHQYHETEGGVDTSFQFMFAAACFLLGVFLTVVFQGRGFDLFSFDSPLGHGIELTVSAGEQLDIHLQVSVTSDIENATMVIEVPSSLKIVGFEDINVLKWQVALKKGKNVLALPVKARRQYANDQVSHLVARVNTGAQQKDFDIKVIIKSSQLYRQGASQNLPETGHVRMTISDLIFQRYFKGPCAQSVQTISV